MTVKIDKRIFDILCQIYVRKETDIISEEILEEYFRLKLSKMLLNEHYKEDDYQHYKDMCDFFKERWNSDYDRHIPNVQ